MHPCSPCPGQVQKAVDAVDQHDRGAAERAVKHGCRQCAIASFLEPGERAGLCALEDGLLLLIGAHQAEDAGEVRTKAMVFRGRLSGRADAIDAMLCASIEDDCRQLGLL